MKWLELPLLPDENIHPAVVAALRARGLDVGSVAESALRGADDLTVLRHARGEGRVVVTHDADFGALAIRMEEPIVGIVYLRPGHIVAAYVIEMLDTLSLVEVEPPFVVVAERWQDEVRVRVRHVAMCRERT